MDNFIIMIKFCHKVKYTFMHLFKPNLTCLENYSGLLITHKIKYKHLSTLSALVILQRQVPQPCVQKHRSSKDS